MVSQWLTSGVDVEGKCCRYRTAHHAPEAIARAVLKMLQVHNFVVETMYSCVWRSYAAAGYSAVQARQQA